MNAARFSAADCIAQGHTPGDHINPAEVARLCEAEPLDGHGHQGNPREYVRVCARGHERRGWICPACARPLTTRGPGVVTCAECPDDDPRPGILVPADEWEAAQ